MCETTNQEIYDKPSGVEKCQAIIFPGHLALFQQLESLLECWVAKHMVQTWFQAMVDHGWLMLSDIGHYFYENVWSHPPWDRKKMVPHSHLDFLYPSPLTSY